MRESRVDTRRRQRRSLKLIGSKNRSEKPHPIHKGRVADHQHHQEQTEFVEVPEVLEEIKPPKLDVVVYHAEAEEVHSEDDGEY